MPIVTPEEMAAIDRDAPEPVEVLIERAGAAVARHAIRMMGGTLRPSGRRRRRQGQQRQRRARRGRRACARRGVRVEVLDAAVAEGARLAARRPRDRRRLRHGLPRRLRRARSRRRAGARGRHPVGRERPHRRGRRRRGAGRRNGDVRGAEARARPPAGARAAPARRRRRHRARRQPSARASGRGSRTSRAGCRRARPRRHKWQAAVWIVAGSPGMTGAAALACARRAARRCGLRAAQRRRARRRPTRPRCRSKSCAPSCRARRGTARCSTASTGSRRSSSVPGSGPIRRRRRGPPRRGGVDRPVRGRRRRPHCAGRRRRPATRIRCRSSRRTTASTSGSPVTRRGRIASPRRATSPPRPARPCCSRGSTTVVADGEGRVLVSTTGDARLGHRRHRRRALGRHRRRCSRKACIRCAPPRRARGCTGGRVPSARAAVWWPAMSQSSCPRCSTAWRTVSMDRNSPVRDMMTTDVLTFGPDDGVEHAMRTLLERDVDAAPVVDDDGAVVGMLSNGDLIVQESELHFPTVMSFLGGTFEIGHKHFEEELRRALGSKVSEVMSTEPVVVHRRRHDRAAATLMHEHDVSRLPVVRDGTARRHHLPERRAPRHRHQRVAHARDGQGARGPSRRAPVRVGGGRPRRRPAQRVAARHRARGPAVAVRGGQGLGVRPRHHARRVGGRRRWRDLARRRAGRRGGRRRAGS